MKKVIPYIASQFKKNKIWMRRTKPHKRDYNIMLAIDDSKSMGLNQVGQMACEALTLIANALSKLEIGQLAIVSFGDEVRSLHAFDEPFTDLSGAQVISQFTFSQQGTKIAKFISSSVNMMELARDQQTGKLLSSTTDHLQIVFIISDGRVLESDIEGLKFALREAATSHVFIVFIIIDNPTSRDSILDIQVYNRGPDGKIFFTPYIDNFPFPYYVILKDITNLPETLADALRQWFELTQAG